MIDYIGIDLNDTIRMMNGNYKDRFKAEYYQTLIRRRRLSSIVEGYHRGTLKFIPDCPIGLLMAQVSAMDSYLCILKYRAQIENIEL